LQTTTNDGVDLVNKEGHTGAINYAVDCTHYMPFWRGQEDMDQITKNLQLPAALKSMPAYKYSCFNFMCTIGMGKLDTCMPVSLTHKYASHSSCSVYYWASK